METRTYDDLPVEIKWHLFSFLSVKDVVAVCSANATNYSLIKDEAFWQHRACQDFYPDVSGIDSCEAYITFKNNFTPRIQYERRLVVAYLAAACFVEASDWEQTEKNTFFKLIDNTLEHLGEKTFLEVVNTDRYDYAVINHVDEPASVKNKIFRRMVLGSKEQSRGEADLLIKEQLFFPDDQTSCAYVHSLTFALMVFAKCNAHLSLRIFLRKISTDQRTALMNKIGADLLCAAAEFGHVEATIELLAGGANPNHYSFMQIVEGSHYWIQPIVALQTLLFKSHRVKTRGEAIQEIITLFLGAGLDVDQPGMNIQQVETGEWNEMPTVRERAEQMVRFIESHRHLYSHEECVGISEILHRITFAPSCCVLAEPGTNSRNDCERSTHTSHPLPHRRPL